MTSSASGAFSAADLPGCAPIPRSALGPALNVQGYHVGRGERSLYRVTGGVYQSGFLATQDGAVRFDVPPSVGHNLPEGGTDASELAAGRLTREGKPSAVSRR